MKIYLKGQFWSETIEFYKSFAEIVSEQEADLIVTNSFKSLETNKPVAANMTATEHIKSPEIINLRGEDLSGFTAVGELTICMAGYLIRKFKKEELKKKIIGIIGVGRIGTDVLQHAEHFKMKIWLYDHSLHQASVLNDLLENSDIVSLHITAEESNRNFINKEALDKMKNKAIFLNSARPWLVNYDALKWALDNKLAGAWFDFEMPFTHSKMITTPHLGGTTRESTKKSEILIAKKVKQYLLSKNK